MTNVNSLAITIVAGVLALGSLISATVLLSAGIAVPDAIWGLLATSSGAAVLGGAVTQGASIAGKE